MYLRECGSAREVRYREVCVPNKLVVPHGELGTENVVCPWNLWFSKGGLGKEKVVCRRDLWFSKGG